MKQAPNAAAKLPKVEALQEPNTKAPGVCFSFDTPPADWGLQGYFRENSAKILRKSKCILKGMAQ